MTLPDDYIAAARLRANRHMACWDQGTSGSLAADVRRLLLEREGLMLELERLKRPGTPRVIGFAGRAGAGKTTAAEAAAAAGGGVVLGFADPLYAALAAALGVPVATLHDRATKELPLPVGKSPRQLLQTLGTEWGRQLVRADLWVWRARQRIEEAGRAGVPLVAICDVRFANEVAAIRELGGEVWWVHRPGLGEGQHVSERELQPQDCDRQILNGDGPDALAWAVADLVRQPVQAAG
jgi:hypothetical protein